MEPGTRIGTAGGRPWDGFTLSFAFAVVLLGCAAIAFVGLLDPYGLRAAPGRAPGPIMDGNQRFMYPQIARGGGYDAAVFGTSTARLLDPEDLDRAFGARFANLSMNAATPYEQMRLARLYLSTNHAKAVLFAIDVTWCEADADRRRLTFRPFPPWLYEPASAWNVFRQVNWHSLATASRVMLFTFGLVPERLRRDGFGIFTPPEANYDARKARAHIYGQGSPLADSDAPKSTADSVAPPDGPMPALAWLDDLLAMVPRDARKLVAFMPVHVAEQGLAGTAKGMREAACKAKVAEIGRARGATTIDFRLPSPITTQDENYWDALHYRLPVAKAVVTGLKEAMESRRDDPNGTYRVLAHP